MDNKKLSQLLHFS